MVTQTFDLPELLKAERAGRILAAGWHNLAPAMPAEFVVSTSLNGAAALAAARHIHNLGGVATILLNDNALDSHDTFSIMLEVNGCMDLPIRQVGQHGAANRSSFVIDGTDSGVPDAALRAVDCLNTPQADTAAPWLYPADSLPALSVKEIREIDRAAMEEYGLPGLCLMENAALGATAVAREMLSGQSVTESAPVTLLVGYGNNGGDALVVARELLSAGIPARALLLGDREKLKGDAAANADILDQADEAMQAIPGDDASLRDMLNASALIVDGIFGTGLDRAVEGVPRSVIEAVNDSARPVLALDIPSGLHGDSGEMMGVCVSADRTVTFAAPKIGFSKADGPAKCGPVTVADIGCPREIFRTP